MRLIVLDTETTGLESKQGDRLIEVGALEMVNRRLTGESFHEYVNPERDIPMEAQAVHGITEEFVQDKPLFSAIADAFIEFIRDAELIIHNEMMSYFLGGLEKIGVEDLNFCRERLKLDVKINTQGLIYWQKISLN